MTIHEQYVRDIAIGLFNLFLQSNPSCAIEDIQLVFLRHDPQNGWRFTVKRVWGAIQGQERFTIEKTSFGAVDGNEPRDFWAHHSCGDYL